jgi:hypothetical protein
MNSPVAFTLSTEDSAFAGLRDALRGALKRVTWRAVAATLVIAVALEAWSVASATGWGHFGGPNARDAESLLSATVTNLTMAFCIMFTTFVADELAARGAKRLPAYSWAVVIGSAAGALTQWAIYQWLPIRARNDIPAFEFFEFLIWGSIIVFIYVSRRSAMLASARMNAAQVQRAEAQRRTLESRLQALQARVEPQFLFGTLARVRELYEDDPAKGSRMLGDLIIYLRAALPHLRESNSTLGQEMDLVNAYFNIMRVNLGERLEIDVSDAARATSMPPMLLLPLIDHVLEHRLAALADSGTIRIAARIAAGRLRVEIADSGQGFAAEATSNDLSVIEDRLHALYGDDGTLAFGAAGSHGTQAALEFPRGSADGDRR